MSTNKRIVNSNNKNEWLIECDGVSGYYRVGDEVGKIPKNSDCIIAGWHFKKGKLFKRGTITFTPGKGVFRTVGNIIEN